MDAVRETVIVGHSGPAVWPYRLGPLRIGYVVRSFQLALSLLFTIRQTTVAPGSLVTIL